MPRALDSIVQTQLTPWESVAADRALLAAARHTGRGALRVYDLAGRVLSLGRYHLAPPPPPPAAGVTLARRLSGGRAVPSGDGFVCLALALPHRSALHAAEPLALAPEQVMNRHVRGLLEGLRLAGVPAFYPGRDLLTADGRVLGLVSFEVDEAGALLFEVVLAAGQSFAVLPRLLDAIDPEGVVPAEMLGPEAVTSVGAELGVTPPVAEMAAIIRRGYEKELGVVFEDRAAPPARGAEDPGWIHGRRRRADLDRRGTVRGQLGLVESFAAVADGRLIEVMLAGDFIANSPAMARLERALAGCAAEPASVRAVVTEVFAAPGNFLLGLGPPTAVADVILAGLRP